MDIDGSVGTPQHQRVLCCRCGTLIEPNPAYMCVGCIRSTVDITEAIPKQATLFFCKGCERYLQPPAQWVSCALESRELLGLCLKRLKGLNTVRLVDANFVWTEPHSRRIKVKLTVQKEVVIGAILQQIFIVEFTVNNQFCDDCRRVEAKDYWKALVQVRQRAEHKKTFYYLEQLLLKHKIHHHAIGVKTIHGGLDFFCSSEVQARKIVDFLLAVVPCRYQQSKTLISHDVHSNTYNYKFTFSVEIVPLCKDDVVCLPVKLAHSLGGIGQIAVVSRVNNIVHLIDPTSGQIAEIGRDVYWNNQFSSISSPKQLTKYFVIDCELIDPKDRVHFSGQGAISNKHACADLWLARGGDMLKTDDPIHARTHLGFLLKPGDTVYGFDLANSNVNNIHLDKMKKDRLPDVVVVKKMYADKTTRNRYRRWKLRHIEALHEDDTSSAQRDYTDFLEDLEEDVQLRQNIDVYVDDNKAHVNLDEAEAETLPRITLEEMLQDLSLNDDPGEAMAS